MQLTGDGHESSSTVARRLARRRTAAVLYVAFHIAEAKNGPHATISRCDFTHKSRENEHSNLGLLYTARTIADVSLSSAAGSVR